MKTFHDKIALIKHQIEQDTPTINVETLHRAQIEPPYEKHFSVFNFRKLAYGMSGLLVLLICFSIFLLPQIINNSDFLQGEPELTSDAMNEIDPLPLVTLTSFYRNNRKLFQNDTNQFEDANVEFVHYYLSTLNVFLQIPTKTPIVGRYGFDYGLLYTINMVNGTSLSYEVFFSDSYFNNANGIILAKVVVLDEVYIISGSKEVTEEGILTSVMIESDRDNYMTVRNLKSSTQNIYTYSIVKEQVLVTKSSIFSSPNDEKVTLLQNKINEDLTLYEVLTEENQFVIEYTKAEERYDGENPLYTGALSDWESAGLTITSGEITAAFDESFIYYAVVGENAPVYEETVPIE